MLSDTELLISILNAKEIMDNQRTPKADASHFASLDIVSLLVFVNKENACNTLLYSGW